MTFENVEILKEWIQNDIVMAKKYFSEKTYD
jgi:hypothetical protein